MNGVYISHYSHRIHIHKIGVDYENLWCEKSHDVRWTMWEFMFGKKDMNSELMMNRTRCEWWIDDVLNEVCMID